MKDFWDERECYIMKIANNLKGMVNNLDNLPLREPTSLAEFYVDTSEARGDDSAAKLVYMINNIEREDKKFLFLGHNGCGKSTELFKVKSQLADTHLVIDFSVSQFVDGISMTFVDIIFLILNNIAETAQKEKIEINEKILVSIYNYWRDENVITFSNEEVEKLEAEGKIGGSFFEILTAKVSGFLQSSSTTKQEIKRRIEPSFSTFIERVNNFIEDFKNKIGDKKLLLIIDDLDKMGITQATDIFIEHSKFITSLKTNIVYTFPIFLYYFPEFRYIESNFDEMILVSMIKVRLKDGTDYEKGIETISNIIKKRVNENLMQENVLRYVVKKSGGSIRSAFSILRQAALNADIAFEKNNTPIEERIISMDDVVKAYRAYKSSLERAIRKDHLPILQEIYSSKRPFVDKDNLLVMELLRSLAVIEYNGERWCDLNPAIEDYLLEQHEIKAKE